MNAAAVALREPRCLGFTLLTLFLSLTPPKTASLPPLPAPALQLHWLFPGVLSKLVSNPINPTDRCTAHMINSEIKLSFPGQVKAESELQEAAEIHLYDAQQWPEIRSQTRDPGSWSLCNDVIDQRLCCQR